MAGLKGRKFKRDRVGRFAAVDIAGGQRTPSSRSRPRLGLAEHVTDAHRGGAGRKLLRRWTPAVHTSENGQQQRGRLVERYDRGREGPVAAHPRGGTYRPQIRAAGWKLTGFQRR